MIAQLVGQVSHIEDTSVIIDVAGVGYELMMSKTGVDSLPDIGQEVKILVHTQMSENSLSLYGFCDLSEKRLFKHLINVNGVGPKLALQILSGMNSYDFIQSLIDKNLSRLTGIPGIGKKTAERLVIELKDKVLKLGNLSQQKPSSDSELNHQEQNYQEALSALINLGYQKSLAEQTLAKISFDKSDKVEEIIKKSLFRLSLQ